MTAILEMGVLRGVLDVSDHKRSIYVACLGDIGVVEMFDAKTGIVQESDHKVMVFEFYKSIGGDTAVYRFSRFLHDMMDGK